MEARSQGAPDSLRAQFPSFFKLPKVRSWTEWHGDTLWLYQVRRDPRTGMVLKGSFPMKG